MNDLDLEVLEMLGIASREQLAALNPVRWQQLEALTTTPLTTLSGTDPLIGTSRQH